jgi:hypothetical protein
MRSQLERVEMINYGDIPEPKFISVPIPDDFFSMDVQSRILYVADKLKTLESEYTDEQGSLIRHTSLVKINQGKLVYSVEYVPLLDNEY